MKRLWRYAEEIRNMEIRRILDNVSEETLYGFDKNKPTENLWSGVKKETNIRLGGDEEELKRK